MKQLRRRALVATMFLMLGASTAVAENQVGHATVIDGDTIKIDGFSHRLQYIDAPELRQTCQRDGVPWLCGAESAKALRNIVRNREVTCGYESEDQYGRRLSVCMVTGRELNAEMVANGYALAFRRYGEQYVKYETNAKSKKLGLWSGEFENPWDYRVDSRKSSPAPKGCEIKGNFNAKGARLYHKPSNPSYSRTIVSSERGERWFCSEAEARKAGWKAAWGPAKPQEQ